MSNIKKSIEQYKEDLSKANQTINDLMEEQRKLKEEKALLERL